MRMISRGLAWVLLAVGGCATGTRAVEPTARAAETRAPAVRADVEPPLRVRFELDWDPPGRWRCENWVFIEPLPMQPIGERVQVTHWR